MLRQIICAGPLLVGALHADLALSETGAPATDLGDLGRRLVALEQQSWVAWKARDAAYFKTFLSADHLEVGVGGVDGRDAVIASVGSPACHVQSYAIGQFRFLALSADAAVLVYRAEQNTTCGGVSVPSPAWATSVYVRRNGAWENAVYQQTPVARAQP